MPQRQEHTESLLLSSPHIRLRARQISYRPKTSFNAQNETLSQAHWIFLIVLLLLHCKSLPSSGVRGDSIPHKRRKDSLLKRQIRSIILSNSIFDKTRCETVTTISKTDLLLTLTGQIKMSQVPDIEKGEVLIDSKGKGTLQKS